MKFAAALTFVALLLAGFWLFYDPSNGETLDTSGTERTDRTEATERGSRDDELAAVASNDRERSQSRSDLPESFAATRSDHGGSSAEAPVASVRTIVGRITDGDGVAIPGADVRVREERSFWGTADASDATHVSVEEDGTFRHTVPEGALEVIAGADGYAPLDRRVSADDVGEIDLGTLRLAPGVTLAGRVVDAAGRPVEGAALHRRGGKRSGFLIVNGRGAVVTTTDGAGRFEIRRQAPGGFDFAVVHARHPDGAFEGSTERDGENVTGIEVRLGEGAMVSGVVRGAPAGTIGELEVRALYSPVGSDGVASGGLRVGRGARIAEDGSFSVHGLPLDAEIDLRLIRGDGSAFDRTRCSEEVACRAGDRGVVVPYSDGASIELRVHDVAGDPVEGATVSTGFDYATPYSGENVDLGGGRYRVGGLWPPDAAGTPIALSVAAPGHENVSLDSLRLRPGEALDVGTVTLTSKPTVTVTVVEEGNGRPVEGARVRLKYQTHQPTGSTRAVFISSAVTDLEDAPDLGALHGAPLEGLTDAEGRCSLEVQPESSAVFEVTHPRFAEIATDPVPIDTLAVPGRAGEFATELALVPGGSIEVTVVDPDGVAVPGREVERKAFDGGPKPAPSTSNERGIARFDGVAAGEHRVRLGAKKKGGGGFTIVTAGAPGGDDEEHDDWSSVSVAAGETAEITLIAPFPSTLRGVVTEAGEPLAGAEVSIAATGDDAGLSIGPLFGGGETVTTDARGEFSFDDVEVGEHELSIDHASRSMTFRQSVDVEEGENETEVDLDVTIVRGICRDASGKPLEGATVSASRVQSSGRRAAHIMLRFEGAGGSTSVSYGGPTSSATTGENGEFELRGVAADVPIVVRARLEGEGSAKSEEIVVPRGGVEDGVEIRFENPGTLEIEVEGDTSAPMLAVATRIGGAAAAPRTESFSGPRVELTGLEPGEWSVRVTVVTSPGDEPVSVTPETRTVDIEPGETATVRFEIE